ncbi:MAG: hypothetical protein H0U55_11305 [Rubrobacteraceae bacterium]|nr:hypothetical protein [Rubrobacteraceae bacterium]
MGGEASRGGRKKRSALRPDTALVPVGEPEREVYVWSLPTCCLHSLKEKALLKAAERRRLELDCSCGRSWRITSSLDNRILERFVTHGGPRVGGSYPAA